MMKVFILSAILVFIPRTFADLTWIMSDNITDDNEYAVIWRANSSVRGYTWFAARNTCVANGADLVSLRTGNLQFGDELDTTNYRSGETKLMWIGLNRLDNFSEWRWSDGQNASDYLRTWRAYGQERCVGKLFKRRGNVVFGRSYVRYVTDCSTEKDGFICKRTKVHSVSRLREPVQLRWWSKGLYSGTFGYEYALGHEPGTFQGFTWRDSQDICKKNGGYLFSIEYSSEQYLLPVLTRKYSEFFWTSLNRLDDVTEWQWSESSVKGRHFIPPIGRDRKKKCAAFSSNDRWLTFNCGVELRGFICKRKKEVGASLPTVPSPTSNTRPSLSCPYNWIHVGKKCYKGFERSTVWRNAEGTCLSLPYLNPNLACVNTLTEMTALTDLVASMKLPGRYWFGLFRESKDEPWMWSDNTRFTMNVTNFYRYVEQDLDYGGGVIMGMEPDIPNGKWDVASNKDGLNVLANGYICQVGEDVRDDI